MMMVLGRTGSGLTHSKQTTEPTLGDDGARGGLDPGSHTLNKQQSPHRGDDGARGDWIRAHTLNKQ